MELKKVTREMCTITLSKEPETIPIEGSFDDPEAVAWVKDQLKKGNEWAWCSVAVRVEWRGIEAFDYLGGCSYEDEAGFRESSGYYDDMVNRALDELNEEINKRFTAIQELIDIVKNDRVAS